MLTLLFPLADLEVAQPSCFSCQSPLKRQPLVMWQCPASCSFIPGFPIQNSSTGWSRKSVTSVSAWNKMLSVKKSSWGIWKCTLCAWLSLSSVWSALDKEVVGFMYCVCIIYSLYVVEWAPLGSFQRHVPEFTGNKSIRFYTALYNQLH